MEGNKKAMYGKRCLVVLSGLVLAYMRRVQGPYHAACMESKKWTKNIRVCVCVSAHAHTHTHNLIRGAA